MQSRGIIIAIAILYTDRAAADFIQVIAQEQRKRAAKGSWEALKARGGQR